MITRERAREILAKPEHSDLSVPIFKFEDIEKRMVDFYNKHHKG